MANALQLLKQLQDLDSELFRLRRQQQAKPQELAAIKAEVAAQAANTKEASERVLAQQMRQKEKEGELQGKEAQVGKLKGQLFQVKTNREYTALQHEIDSLKADAGVLEEEILKLLEAMDQAKQQEQAQRQQLAGIQGRERAEEARIKQEVAQLEEQVAQLQRQRQGLAPDVPHEALEAYERVLNVRAGIALVPVINESCGGCDRRLPPQVLNEVLLDSGLVTCESCNRILYAEKDAS